MSVFKRGEIYHYDFWYRNVRYRGSTEQRERDDADQVESDLKSKLRRQAKGLTTFDPKDSPLIADFVEVHFNEMKKRLTRPDILERTLRVCMAFWGARPRKNPVAGGVYKNLRLIDPILHPELLDQFDIWMATRVVRRTVTKTGAAPGVAGSTKNSYISAMSQLYQTALRPRFVSRTGVTRNPFADVERHPTHVRVVDATVEDLHAWIRAAAPHLQLAMIIGGLAHKLRVEQILKLRFDQHLDRDLTRIVFTEFKTRRHTGEDQVTVVSRDLRAMLDALRRLRPGVKHVITFRGKPISSIKTAARKAAIRAGLKYGMADGGVTFHALRKIANTELARAGVAELLLAAAGGHKDPATTRKHYVHIPTADEVAVVERLSGILQLRELGESAVGKLVGTRSRRTPKLRATRRRSSRASKGRQSA